MTNSNTEDIIVKKIETRKPVLKDGIWHIHQETIEYTNDEQEETRTTNNK